MPLKISLAGNPNSGKTTMFNALTGGNQRVGNWPGVTVERKEGRLKSDSTVIIQDLPGIYSLSPYTLEEVVTRDYLTAEQPDVIINIVDAANLERNLYLTTQLTELGIPVIIALNMIDAAGKNGIMIDIAKLGEALGCPVIATSAVRGNGCQAVIDQAVTLAKSKFTHHHRFSERVENAIADYEPSVITRYILDVAAAFNRFYHNCKILSAEDVAVRATRVEIVRAVNQVLANAFPLICMKKMEKI